MTTVHIPATEVHSDLTRDHTAACDPHGPVAVLGGPDEVSCASCLRYFGWLVISEDFEDFQDHLDDFLAEVPNATPAEIQEAVQEFLDRDPREDATS